MDLEIRVEDPARAEIAALLHEHLRHMVETTPDPRSRHALDIDGLRRPGITFWAAWREGVLAGCAALKELDAAHAEIKSMKTASDELRRGTASALLQHLMDEAQRRGYRRLSLETGAQPYFEPARRLYGRFGFRPCPAFPPYVPDASSVFMTREL